MKNTARREIDKMLELGESSFRPAPGHPVKQKYSSIHFCVDYHKVNQVAKFDAYPELKYSGRRGSSQVHILAKGYRQVPMAEESKEKTAFTTPFGFYKFTVIPPWTPHCTSYFPEADELGAQGMSRIC